MNLAAPPNTDVIYAYHHRDLAFLTHTLLPGRYSLVVETGPVQTTLTGFPSCSEYTFKIRLQPKASAGLCWSHKRLPSSLNTPQYLGHSGVVHLFENFLAPVTGFANTESVFFTVATESMFRVWTEIHILDFDFYLYEDGIFCNRSDSWFDEEELVWNLKPGKNYMLNVINYHYTPSDPHVIEPDCWIYKLAALAIAPFTTGTTCQDALPAYNLIPNYNTASNSSFFSKARYSLNQSTRSLVHRMPFTVTRDSIFFRYLSMI